MSKVARLSFALTLFASPVASAQGDPQNPSCELDPDTGVLTVVVDDNDSTIQVLDDGGIVATGDCPADATVTSVETIRVTGGSIANKVFVLGAFAPGRTPEADGASEIEFVFDLDDGADRVRIGLTEGDDVVRFTTRGLDVGGDLDRDMTFPGVETINVEGAEGNDVIDASGYAGASALILGGGGGDDLLIGSAAGDELYGNNPAGSFFEADELRGGPGDDYIDGGHGDDKLVGGSGDDTFYQGAANSYDGRDTIRGGPGVDTVDYSDRTAPVYVSLNGLRDDGMAGENDLVDTAVENVLGGSAADVLVGSAAGNLIIGGGGDDEIYGEGGDDLLRGGDGLDLLVGDDGDDNLRGGAGDDSLDGGPGIDMFLGDAGNDTFINDDGVAETVNCGTGALDDPEPSASDTFVDCELI